jgi:hypothetical protein
MNSYDISKKYKIKNHGKSGTVTHPVILATLEEEIKRITI